MDGGMIESQKANGLDPDSGTIIQVVKSAPNYAVYALDPKGLVTVWTAGCEEITGWASSDAIGKHHSFLYCAEDIAAGVADRHLAQVEQLGRVEQESWRVRKNGSEFLAHLTTTALHDEAGQLSGYGKILRDTTDEAATKEAIVAREQHLQSILDTVPDAMVIIDERGLITSFSAAAERLFGYSEAEVLGANVSSLMPSPDRERHDSYIGRYLSTSERRIIGIGRIVVGQRRDGTTFPMELSIGEAGHRGHRVFTGFIHDLTESDRNELQLKELQAELIHVSRLSAMGTMASTLAHELNQPLTAIANYLETTRDLLVDPDAETVAIVRDALDEAAKESHRAGHIVRRLRDFVARGETEKRIEDLPRLIEEAAALGLVGARERGVRSFFDFDPAASPVLADRIQVQQVLVNLIRNAVEAMAQVAIRDLTITTRRRPKAMVQVSVADTGPGISEQVAPQLFEAFVSSKTDGMGLGLSICRTIIEAHGGRIWTDGAPNGGAAFHFTLMQARPEDEHDA
ncbi:Adaptive-response sensory-kinase SasA [Sphingobium sp. AntQ-1]|nr:Adaptive-response sensory-kinase SasA [Sphingobium sp. AntQ-1]GLI98712.1 sensor protein FixL [Sphingobium sp. BS19]